MVHMQHSVNLNYRRESRSHPGVWSDLAARRLKPSRQSVHTVSQYVTKSTSNGRAKFNEEGSELASKSAASDNPLHRKCWPFLSALASDCRQRFSKIARRDSFDIELPLAN